MDLHIENALTAPKDFLKNVYDIDKLTYSPELCGIYENLQKRYAVCNESFLLVYDGDYLVGYINFFPVGDKLHSEMIDRNDHRMRDDDIKPEEIHDWSTDKNNDIFIISIAIQEEYRKGEAILLLSNAFLEFLRSKDSNGFKVTSISGYAVSLGGVKFLKRMNASLLKDTDEEYHYFYSSTENVQAFLQNGYTLNTYKKTYKDDLYFFLPMTSTGVDGSFKKLLDAERRIHTDDEDFDYTPTEDLSHLPFGDLYCKVLNRHIEYECNCETFKNKQMARIYLGDFQLACYDDDYDGIPLKTETAHIFITAHKNTGLYIITLAIPENDYNPSQLIDQMSTGHLEILDPETNSFVKADKYIGDKFDLTVCGESKCVICMSNKPEIDIELPYILSGETMISKHIDYKIRPEHMKKLTECRAIYDYYDSYISRSVIAFVFKDYSDEISVRISDEASELFIVEIVLFQNTAVLRTNRRVVKELEDNHEISMQDIDDMYIEFGKTVLFWNSDIFKYPFSQIEADAVIESFGIKETLEDYHRNQQFLDRLIELKSNITEQKSNNVMNNILFFLSCMEGSSVTLGAVLWIWHLLKSSTELPLGNDTFLRFGWVFLFIAITLLIYRIASSSLTKKLNKKNKGLKFKKK